MTCLVCFVGVCCTQVAAAPAPVVPAEVTAALETVVAHLRRLKGAAHDAQVKKEQARLAEKAEKARAEAAKKLAQMWTRDELSLLAKATVKYPPGTKTRWEVIAQAIGTISLGFFFPSFCFFHL